MAVRLHSDPQRRQHPWIWECDTPDCDASGVGVTEADARRHDTAHAATHTGPPATGPCVACQPDCRTCDGDCTEHGCPTCHGPIDQT